MHPVRNSEGGPGPNANDAEPGAFEELKLRLRKRRGGGEGREWVGGAAERGRPKIAQCRLAVSNHLIAVSTPAAHLELVTHPRQRELQNHWHSTWFRFKRPPNKHRPLSQKVK